MLLIEVYDLLPSFTASGGDLTQILDAAPDVFDAEFVGHLNTGGLIHQKVYGKGHIALMLTFPFEHRLEETDCCTRVERAVLLLQVS